MYEPEAGGRGKIIIAVAVVVAVTAAGFALVGLTNVDNSGNPTTTPTQPLPPLEDEPIYIANNTDFVHKAQERGWSGTGTQNDPFVIDHENIQDPAYCIRIVDVTAYFVIRNCVLRCFEPGQGIGINVRNSTNGVVESCDVSAGVSGVELFLSHNFVIKNCSVFSPIFAVNMSGSHDNQILENDIESDFFAVSAIGSNRSLIQNNTIHGMDAGIVAQWSWNSTVRNNRIEMNSTGIDLQVACHNWTLIDNEVSVDRGVGICISESSSFNRIFKNHFSHVNGTNAIDDGMNNTWDDGINWGNWWSDYNGIGVYPIQGTAGSVDHYPQVLE